MKSRTPKHRTDADTWATLAMFLLLLLVVSVVSAHLARGEEPIQRMELLWGAPTPVEACHATYVRGHCGLYTVFVIEYLTADNLKGSANRKGLPFVPDEDVPPEFRATLTDYRGSHLDRGHMAPAGDATRGKKAMAETFLLSNMFGQTGKLNRGPWRLLEEHVRDIASEEGVEVWSVTLPLFVPDEDGVVRITTFGKHRLWRPTHTAKCILVRRNGELSMHAWKCPNVENPPPFEECETSVDEIEQEAGLDLFTAVSKEVQDELEAEFANAY